MSRALKLTAARRAVLKQYAETSDGNFMQGVPGASELWRPMGLLEWHGTQYGSHFYSITPAGREALKTPEPMTWRPTSTQLAAMRKAAEKGQWHAGFTQVTTGRSLQKRGMFRWTRAGYVLTAEGTAMVEAMASVKPGRLTIRQQVLELDPKAYLAGPTYIGTHKTYSVHAGSGEEIGWAEGNEGHPSFAWARARDTLQRKQRKAREAADASGGTNTPAEG